GEGEPKLTGRTQAFLACHPAPIVFTLGSSAVRTARDFYAVSARAAARLGRPAVLGTDDWTIAAGAPADDGDAPILLTGDEPDGRLFPHAGAVVHQGGVGTTAQAMRAGRSMLVVPFAHDQPDQAARIARAGIGRRLARPQYESARVARELDRLL